MAGEFQRLVAFMKRFAESGPAPEPRRQLYLDGFSAYCDTCERFVGYRAEPPTEPEWCEVCGLRNRNGGDDGD